MIDSSRAEILDVSLIICSRNRPALLEQAIRSVLAGTSLPSEILIIDQSDTPHSSLSKGESRYGCSIRYHRQAGTGLSKAKNAAAALAAHDVIATIDDDELAAHDWLKNLIYALNAAGPDSIVTGQVRPGTPEIAGGFSTSTTIDARPVVYRGRLKKDVLSAGNMAVRRELLRLLGGFDERLGVGTRFPAGEDSDLALRSLEVGYQIVYVPEALLYHRAWRNQYLRQRWREGRGAGGFYAKYIAKYESYGLKRLRSEVGRRVVRWPYMIRHERRKAVGDLVYIAALVYGTGEWLLRY
jgi:GT2 family glycosyltransferase